MTITKDRLINCEFCSLALRPDQLEDHLVRTCFQFNGTTEEAQQAAAAARQRGYKPPAVAPADPNVSELLPGQLWVAGNGWHYMGYWLYDVHRLRVNIKRHVREDMSEAKVSFFSEKAGGWNEVGTINWSYMASLATPGDATIEEIIQAGHYQKDIMSLIGLASQLMTPNGGY